MSFVPRELVKVSGVVLTVRSVDGNVLELESADGAFFGFRHINSVERVPAAQEAAAAVVAHTVPVGSGGAPYRSAVMSGSDGFARCPPAGGRAPMRDSLMPSRTAAFTTRYSAKKKTIATAISHANAAMVHRAMSVWNWASALSMVSLPPVVIVPAAVTAPRYASAHSRALSPVTGRSGLNY